MDNGNNNNEPSWLGKEKSTRSRSTKQERGLAKKLGGRVTSNSGARFGENDVKTRLFDIEAKTTKSKQYIIKEQELEKMETRASAGRVPVFVIGFEDTGRSYAMIPLSEFISLSDSKDAELLNFMQ